MSFLTELMKKEVRRMQGNDQFDSWELFPYSLQTLAKWADVYQDRVRPDKLRDHILIYKNLLDAKPGEVYPVAIRLQGLLRQFRIDRFGNWSGAICQYFVGGTLRSLAGDNLRTQSRL
ncbi:hypothetical protein EDB19DRAFT_1831229 [Suillus lakei]|nr:hypothetical protein EDB19DRAFT_1831229 [Suillus lakei]